jgi:hypothetical protein
MHVEITRLLTVWLKHPQFGVNALLPGIPRDLVGDATMEDEEPKPVTVYNDVDFELDDVGGFQPPSVPSLAVIADVAPDGVDIAEKLKSGHSYGFTVGIGYYSEFGANNRARARRDGNYVLRAVGQSIVRFSQASQRTREINQVQISKFTKLTIQRVAGAVPASTLMGMVFADGVLLNKAP